MSWIICMVTLPSCAHGMARILGAHPQGVSEPATEGHSAGADHTPRQPRAHTATVCELTVLLAKLCGRKRTPRCPSSTLAKRRPNCHGS